MKWAFSNINMEGKFLGSNLANFKMYFAISENTFGRDTSLDTTWKKLMKKVSKRRFCEDLYIGCNVGKTVH